MNDFFFGPFAVAGWFILSLVFVFCATWTWLVVREVGGVRGTAMATLCTCLAVICTCFGLILARQVWISSYLLGSIVTAMFPPMTLSIIVLADLYAADHNHHRSFTARSYFWYERTVRGQMMEDNK